MGNGGVVPPTRRIARNAGAGADRSGTRPGPAGTRRTGRERAAIVGLIAGRARRLDAERSLDELSGLAEAAGAEVVLRMLQERPKPDPSTFLGAGKIATLAVSCAETEADVVIFDNELTPAQLRQIEEQVGRKVSTHAVILDIFDRRAATREGKLQVELAQLKYLLAASGRRRCGLSRLRRAHRTRGTGRNQARKHRRRIGHDPRGQHRYRARRQRRSQLRERRPEGHDPTVGLVGYT